MLDLSAAVINSTSFVLSIYREYLEASTKALISMCYEKKKKKNHNTIADWGVMENINYRK